MSRPPSRPRPAASTTITFDSVPEVTDVPTLFALATAMEREAARRYAELTARMADEDEPELAALFARLREAEDDHETGIGAWAAREGIAAAAHDFHWDSPEAAAEDEIAEAGGSHMGTWRALLLAQHNEERAFAFYSNIAAKTPDPDVRRYAERMASEELEHVALLRTERRRAWHDDRTTAMAMLPAAGAPDVDSVEALERYVSEAERELVVRLRGKAQAADEAGASRLASLLRTLAGEAEARLHGAAREAEAIARSTPSGDCLQLLQDEERRLSRLYEGYVRLIDRARDERLLRRAQEETAMTLSRLARLRDERARLRSEAEARDRPSS